MANVSQRVLFIGAGRMAQAIIEGLKKKNEFEIIVANQKDKDRLQFVKEKYGVETTGNWTKEIGNVDIIILAMPPEVHEPILKVLAKQLNGQLVMTVAAGISTTYMEEMLPPQTPVVWVMPNTAAKVGRSMSLYATGKNVTEEHIKTIEALISGIGEVEKVTEQQIHELTAVTSSAPAFIYMVADALEKITLQSGVSTAQARKLVSHMIAGSAEMLITGTDPQQLADEVATPGGSTAAGLDVLQANQLDNLLLEAIKACRKKAGVKEVAPK